MRTSLKMRSILAGRTLEMKILVAIEAVYAKCTYYWKALLSTSCSINRIAMAVIIIMTWNNEKRDESLLDSESIKNEKHLRLIIDIIFFCV